MTTDGIGLPDPLALSTYRFETIHHDGIVAFSRGVHPVTGSVVVLAHAVSGDAEVDVEVDAAHRIGNEFALRALLRPKWALVPRALVPFRGRAAILYGADPGQPLATLPAGRQPVATALAITLGACAALKGAHRRGLVHRAVTPCSLFVDTSGHWRLGNFGLAIRHADAGSPSAEHPVRLTMAGDTAPAYMSPEHTGRTPHAIDARSDLYSVGVIFYQLLTGQLPLAARDPSDLAEWVHAHIAGTPLPPHEIAPEIPEMLSRIALKLLEKSPARRYRSATALEADLKHCATAWQAHGRIDPFAPGERVTSTAIAAGGAADADAAEEDDVLRHAMAIVSAQPETIDDAARDLLLADAARLRERAQADPVAFSDKAWLVEAELARIDGHALEAMAHYEQAIAHATARGAMLIAALAHERAARHGAALGLASAAAGHRREARDAFRQAGATARALQLEAGFPELVEPSRPRTWQVGTGAQTLDAESVIKASRALTEEIHLEQLIDKLLTIALEYAAAQRGLLIRIQAGIPIVEARADTTSDGIRVRLVQDPVAADTLPAAMLRATMQHAQVAIVGDATGPSPFDGDPYFIEHPRASALCIPMMRNQDVIGALYLENRLVRDAFTLDHTRLLALIAAQAAISLRTARLYDDLLAENAHRQRVERELRASEASLAMGESVSHTGSWRWDRTQDRFFCSEELRRLYELPHESGEIAFEDFLARIHPEDRDTVRQLIAVHVGRQASFHAEHRIVRTSGSIRYAVAIGKPVPDGGQAPDYVGTVTDITARRHAEDALRAAQADLARVARATTVGQLTASIAHEINQPLMSIVSNAGASLRWLARATPEIANAREGLEAIASEGQRAGDMIRSLQALTRNAAPVLAPVDIHEAIRHIATISRSEIERRQIALHLALRADPPIAFGDGIQLQQVILNLLVNAIDAMSEVRDRPRVMHIVTRIVDDQSLEVSVADSGIGIGAALVEQVFEPFYTTKANGMGMGLAICRSIIEAHRGQLRATALVPHGSAFSFTIPLRDDSGT